MNDFDNETVKKIDEIHRSLFDPDTGLHHRIRELESDASELKDWRAQWWKAAKWVIATVAAATIYALVKFFGG